MLHASRPDSWVTRDNAPPEYRSSAESIAEVVAFIRRRLSMISLTCLVVLGVAVLYLIAAVPTFTATAQLLIDSKGGSGDSVSVSTIVNSQIAIISSEGIARDVIRKLDLAQDPEFVGRGTLRRTIRSMSRLLGWSKPESESSAMRD